MLKNIKNPSDILKLNRDQLKELALEIRKFLVRSIGKNGGHLASNLGVVELTLALMMKFDFPKDSIVWDVGHQSYVYKILTGRLESFDKLRQFGGISGFPNREESEYDVFGTGHASTSIAAANGIAVAKKYLDDESYTIAVIGDGALTGGLALESINNLINLENKLIIILNDNEMSIDENVGIASCLSKIRMSKKYNEIKTNISSGLDKLSIVGDVLYKTMKSAKDSVKRMLLDDLNLEKFGLKYYGPVDGHDINSLTEAFEDIKNFNRPVMLHVKTIKGKGYRYAMSDPSKFHGIAPFDIKTGKLKVAKKESYTDIFSSALLKLMDEHREVFAITAAMISGTGLTKIKNKYSDRLVDVGIAEEYAVTFSAGMATQGVRPVVCIYSTFLQRAYDQILHDVCLQNLPVIFAIDRAGIVGADGATHQGIFDISYLNGIPNITLLAPINARELEEALQYAYSLDSPVAIRYPKSNADFELEDIFEPFEARKFQEVLKGEDICIIGVGTMLHTCIEVRNKLLENGVSAAIINPRILKPLNKNEIDKLISKYKFIVTVEEGILSGGFGSSVTEYVTSATGTPILNIAIKDEFIPHGSISEIKEKYGLDANGIFEEVLNRWKKIEKKT